MAKPAQPAVEDALREIAKGLAPGTKLPPERELAESLAVSRMTLRTAVESLQFDGLLVRRPGRAGGTYVAGPAPIVELASVRGIVAQLRGRHDVRSDVLEFGRMAAADAPTKVAAALRLTETDEVYRLFRRRHADEYAVMLEDSWLPAAVMPGLEEHDITGSVYTLLRDVYDSEPTGKRELLHPGVPSAEEARQMGLGARHPILRIARTAFRADGTPVEYSEDLYRSDLLQIQVSSGEINGAD